MLYGHTCAHRLLMREGRELFVSRGILASGTRPSLVGALVWLLERALHDLEPPGPQPRHRSSSCPPRLMHMGLGGMADHQAPGQAGGGVAASGAAPRHGSGRGRRGPAASAPLAGGDQDGSSHEEADAAGDGRLQPHSPRAGASSTGSPVLGSSLGSSASASSLGSLRTDLVMDTHSATVLWDGPGGIIYSSV